MPDYKLDTGKKYVMDIFAPKSFYCIPDYQRPYVWGDEQVTALLEDLTTAMDYDQEKEYFLGCMIWNTKKGDGKIDYSVQEILDGQQRFLTLYILHGIIRDLSTTEGLKETVRERMKQKENKYNGVPERNRVEFIIRDEDREFLEKYLLEEDGTNRITDIEDVVKRKDSSTSVKNMANAILIMRKWWLKKLATSNDAQDYIDRFFFYLSNKVLALFLATPDDLDDAYNLFTVLNSRGLQLQASDILRAQNLRVIRDDKLRNSYAQKWESFENSIDVPYKSFDELLWALAFIKIGYRSNNTVSLSKAFHYI